MRQQGVESYEDLAGGRPRCCCCWKLSYLRSCKTSSPRWRSERPPIVFDGEIRHWVRILLALTRPYLGTARIMSNAFADMTYSGGSRSSDSIFFLPAFRSRFSCARLDRISFARRSARIRCSWLRSGTAVAVSTEGTIGGGDYMPAAAARKGGLGLATKFASTLG